MKSKVYQADWLDQISSGIDFRCRHNTSFTDSIVTRAHHLAGQDRDLVLAMYRDGHTAANIARLGTLEPRQVRRHRTAILELLASSSQPTHSPNRTWQSTK